PRLQQVVVPLLSPAPGQLLPNDASSGAPVPALAARRARSSIRTSSQKRARKSSDSRSISRSWKKRSSISPAGASPPVTPVLLSTPTSAPFRVPIITTSYKHFLQRSASIEAEGHHGRGPARSCAAH